MSDPASEPRRGPRREPRQTSTLIGPRPPQQARSRALLERVLTAAEEIVSTEAADEITMARVAERAGVSVGALYRRFEGKDQLLAAVWARMLDRLEADLADALRADRPDLAAVVDVYVDAVVRNVAGPATVFRYFVTRTGGPEPADRPGSTMVTLQRLLLDAAAHHLGEIRRPDPITALTIAARLVLGVCIHRLLTVREAPDGLPWHQWRDEIADMVLLYLTNPPPPRRTHPRTDVPGEGAP